MRWRAGLSLLVCLLGCSDTDERRSGCEDAQCRQAQIIAAWQTDRAQAQRLLEALPDSVERTAVVSRLVDLYPAQVQALCDGLPQGPSQDRCRRASSRPHLHVDTPMTGAQSDPAKLPPIERRLVQLLQRDSPLSEVAPTQGPCADAEDLPACLLAAALKQAEAKDARGAAALCHAVPLGGQPAHRWRSECFFGAAEARLKAEQSAGYAAAIDLCTAAEHFGPFCIDHLLTLLARSVPAADVSSEEAWAEVLRSQGAIEATWAGAEVMPAMRATLWARALSIAVQSAQTVAGDALGFIPDHAVVHLRAAVAARMISEQGADAHSLQGWISQVQSALGKRAGRTQWRPQHGPLKQVGGTWPRSAAESDGVALVPYRGLARRAVSEAVQADIAICVLEAAARQQPLPQTLLASAQAYPDPAVQWTAAQLLKWASAR